MNQVTSPTSPSPSSQNPPSVEGQPAGSAGVKATEARPGVETRSLANHLSELANETTTLIRKEVQLARAEFQAGLDTTKTGAAMLASAGAVMYAGGIFILGAVTVLIASYIPLWVSALAVGVVTLGIGFAMYARGKKKMRPTEMVPRRSFRALKETAGLMERHA